MWRISATKRPVCYIAESQRLALRVLTITKKVQCLCGAYSISCCNRPVVLQTVEGSGWSIDHMENWTKQQRLIGFMHADRLGAFKPVTVRSGPVRTQSRKWLQRIWCCLAEGHAALVAIQCRFGVIVRCPRRVCEITRWTRGVGSQVTKNLDTPKVQPHPNCGFLLSKSPSFQPVAHSEEDGMPLDMIGLSPAPHALR